MKFISIDFEYCESNEIHMGLICAVLQDSVTRKTLKIWLRGSPSNQKKLAKIIEGKHQEGYTFLAYNSSAEAKCFIALGLNPIKYSWIDLMAFHRQLLNCDTNHQYGKIFGPFGKIIQTVAPKVPEDLWGDERQEFLDKFKARMRKRGLSTEKIEASLATAILNYMDLDINKVHKKEMIQVILQLKNREATEEEKADILEYCRTDVIHLEPLYWQMTSKAPRLAYGADNPLEKALLNQGRWSACIAVMESNGIPISIKKFKTLAHNIPYAKRTLIEDFNKRVFVLYIDKVKRTGRAARSPFIPPDYGFSEVKWAEFIDSLDLRGKKWPISKKSGKYKADSDTVGDFSYIPELKEFERLKNALSAFGSYTADPAEIRKRHNGRKKVMQDDLGSDNRIRPYLNQYGTQTARNGHKASTFILAQSAWLRAIIEPPEGYAVMESDYSSQEVFIGAVLSQDKNLLDSYLSGDPYASFAVLTGAIPKDISMAEIKSHPEHGKTRDLYKATVLGVSYGMRAASLSIKITRDTGVETSIAEAEKLLDQHARVYRKYYAWRESIKREYTRRPLKLWSGWYLGMDNPSTLSILNFPVQGSGSDILREAVYLALERYNIHLFATVHDSLNYLAPVDAIEETAKKVEECMLEASFKVLGVEGMRVGHDAPYIKGSGDYVTGKGYRFYKMLGHYLHEDHDIIGKETKEIYKLLDMAS